jgi:hypothetical protein
VIDGRHFVDLGGLKGSASISQHADRIRFLEQWSGILEQDALDRGIGTSRINLESSIINPPFTDPGVTPQARMISTHATPNRDGTLK